MAYYLNEVENKNLVKNLRPLSRGVGVTEELRGWNWDQSPLKPYHDASLPMYLLCSNYCPTSRDVYLNRVESRKPEWNHFLSLGKVLHDTVAEAYTRAKAMEFDAAFKGWYGSNNYEGRMEGNFQLIRRYAQLTWDYIISGAKVNFQSAMSNQPYSTSEDMLSTAVPFLVEHRISGELLGCSGILSVDCYDYLRSIIFDLKTGSSRSGSSHRLYPTGYALVFESVYEVPVDIGGTVFIGFKDDRIIVRRDLFHINDDLRSWWIETRDQKAEIVQEELDPGISQRCPQYCIYRDVCGG